MPKDNEKIPLPDLGPITPSDIRAFPAEQMVRCEECLRANPPIRINCMYCAATLPITAKTARLQKPELRRLERWESGFNTILTPAIQHKLSVAELQEVSDFLKLTPDQLQRIISADRPLPLARASSKEEAALISRRLNEFGLSTLTLPDKELRLDDRAVVRIRSVTIEEESITGYQPAGGGTVSFLFNQIKLLVMGRLFVKRVQVKERKSRSAEADLVAASEFSTDEGVLDIYAGPESPPWRFEANSFDFAALGPRKALVAGENLITLMNLICELAPQAQLEDRYTTVRQTLDPIWPAEQRTEASGWHRERPGKYSTSGITESSNENQFTRYSRLQYYLKVNPLGAE